MNDNYDPKVSLRQVLAKTIDDLADLGHRLTIDSQPNLSQDCFDLRLKLMKRLHEKLGYAVEAEVKRREKKAQRAQPPADGNVVLETIDPEDELMSLDEWKQGVACHGFTDYDGYGDLATTTSKSNIAVSPSDVGNGRLVNLLRAFAHLEFTHIVWYNK